MGRPATPPALKLLQGRAPGRDSGGRPVDAPPPFERVAPDAPDFLDEVAAAEWARIVPELERLRLVKRLDRAALAAYCEMWSLFVRATNEVHENGLTVRNTSVKKDGTESVWFTTNPAVATQKSAQAALKAWASEFGLTPSAEGKVKVGEGGDPDGDDFD
jgi:P27 family predicted phage terminase small subunit